MTNSNTSLEITVIWS